MASRFVIARRGLAREVQHSKTTGSRNAKTFHSAPQPNCQVNADANTGHGFAIFMACVGALRPGGLRRRLPW